MDVKLFLLFNVLILINLTVSDEDVKCGQRYSKKLDRSLSKKKPVATSPSRIGKIVGGKNARSGDMPFIVSIQQNYGHFCGGSILNRKWVLTAAHCFKDKGIPEKEIQVKSGSYEIPRDQPGTYHSVIRYIIHDDFDLSHYRNDIAVIEVDPPFTFTAGKKFGRYSVGPICMPKENALYLGQATVAGWGLNASNGDQAMAKLQAIDIDLFDCTQNCLCKSAYHIFTSELMVCAGIENGTKDACQGDSGGPLMGIRVDGNGQEVVILIGIVSYGEGCAEAYKPGVYADLSKLLPWVKQKIAPDIVYTPKY